jgi:hypothetical protein
MREPVADELGAPHGDLPAIRNEELRGLVVKVAPAFEAHMLAAQNLERKLGGGSGAQK